MRTSKYEGETPRVIDRMSRKVQGIPSALDRQCGNAGNLLPPAALWKEMAPTHMTVAFRHPDVEFYGVVDLSMGMRRLRINESKANGRDLLGSNRWRTELRRGPLCASPRLPAMVVLLLGTLKRLSHFLASNCDDALSRVSLHADACFLSG